ncbi:MAG: DUF2802 domain-containing protein [Shewanella sp.]|nr:DUF2802 domain-containing protein [Shewanella sp.]MCF1429735.1 DUF2802 domain-containing protein [Shewanella sp.]MCF1438219.1 DUF2802 domain-containing protein [Shewanella sp.]MCF1457072.1 DUF2802 domain-containing protein [Shewanella sp.]
MQDYLELLVALSTALVVGSGIAIWCHRHISKLNGRVDALTVLFKDADKQNDQLRQELKELRSGIIGVGRRVLELEKLFKQQQVKLEERAEQDPGARLYTRAAKMVSLGAGIDELVAECELPRAEAELLLRLHRKAS